MFSFDSSPKFYLVVANLLLILLACLSIFTVLDYKITLKKYFFSISILLCLFVIVYLRLPVIVLNEVYNPDENLFLVGAMTLAHEPIYWESVDGCTSGPFNFYILTFFCEIFNQPYDYISGRILGILLILGSVALNYLALKRFFSSKIAFLSIFPAVVFLSTTRYYDFINFSSEHLPIFLLSIMTLIYAHIYTKKDFKASLVFMVGLIAGAIIFTKLQVIPIAFFLVLATYWLIYKEHFHSFKKLAFWLTIGGATVPLGLLLMAFNLDFLDKMWVFYFKNNLSYGERDTNIFITIFQSLNDKINVFIKIIVALGSLLIINNLVFKKLIRPNLVSFFIIIFLTTSIFCVYATGFMFHHYLLLLIFPTVLLFALFLNDLLNLKNSYVRIVIFSMITMIILVKSIIYPFGNDFISSENPQRPLQISKMGQKILNYTKPNEKLVVWGDNGHLYLETKRQQGIRWSNSHWGMYSDTLQKVFQKEFIKELKEKPFPVFIDAHPTKGTFMTRDKLGYETNAELKEHIDKNYTFIGEFDEQRMFVHNIKLQENLLKK